MELLLKEGADIGHQDLKGLTAIDWAALNGQVQVCPQHGRRAFGPSTNALLCLHAVLGGAVSY